MPASALALVLAAAALHAVWNALSKGGRDPLCFLWLAMTIATALSLPPVAWRLVADGLPPVALPFVAATGILHALYFYALARAYRSGEFSLVYPMARGLGVAVVPLIAWLALDEGLSALGAAGIALVVIGIVMLQLAPQGWRGITDQLDRASAGTWWALLTGLTIAAYSLVDKAGVARLHPVPYIGLMFIGQSVLLAPLALARPEALGREWRMNGRTIVAAAVMTITAYLLVLFAFRLSKAAYVVAAREVSIVLSAAIGSRWFNEGPLGPRLAGAGVVLAGVVCVALAR